MAQLRNVLLAKDVTIDRQTLCIAGLLLVIFGLIGVIVLKQNDFTCHIPPVIDQGAVIKPDQIAPASAYVFAQAVWRTLNTWKTSGVDDYRKAIDQVDGQCYVSEGFKRWLDRNYAQKQGSELNRTRDVALELNYDPSQVRTISNNRFLVTLDMQVIERVNGSEIKNIRIRYPLTVVADQRPCNQFGMRIEGFASQPTRLHFPGEHDAH